MRPRQAFGVMLLVGVVAVVGAVAAGSASGRPQELTPADRHDLLQRFKPILYFHAEEAWAPGRSSSKRCSANARKMSPSTGPRYSAGVRLELARSASAAAQSRRSSSARSVNGFPGADTTQAGRDVAPFPSRCLSTLLDVLAASRALAPRHHASGAGTDHFTDHTAFSAPR